MDEPETTRSRLGLIAVVEDDSSMREVLRRSLYRGGYAVTAARNGAEAIETVSREFVEADERGLARQTVEVVSGS